jgi:hypothetical protein
MNTELYERNTNNYYIEVSSICLNCIYLLILIMEIEYN